MECLKAQIRKQLKLSEVEPLKKKLDNKKSYLITNSFKIKDSKKIENNNNSDDIISTNKKL